MTKKTRMTTTKTPRFKSIELELPDALFVRLAVMAHEKDITFNQLIRDIIAEMLLRDAEDEESKEQ